ncbi:MAG: helix-turn-helix transcriptional regulator [Clostridiales bacterium]|nr:helix-turn-helix transcriptional regulator [Clostridiales bacterium]
MNNLQMLIDDIEEHLFEDISLNVLATKANYSKYHFSREFNTKVGMSISQYIQERRFTYAVQMLSENQRNITEIAFKCGFNSLAYFSKKFKEKYQITPKQYVNGQFYISLVDRITLGDVKMFKTIDETNKYIYDNLNNYENLVQIFSSLENILLHKEEDVYVYYFSITETIGEQGEHNQILWYCKLNLLTGTSDSKIIRNTAFIPMVGLEKLYKTNDGFYVEIINKKSKTRMQGKLVAQRKQSYMTDFCRIREKYLVQATGNDEVELTQNEKDRIEHDISELMKNGKNNISFKATIESIEHIQIMRMLSEKVLISYILNRDENFSIITALLNLKNQSFTYENAHGFRNFGKNTTILRKGNVFEVQLDGDPLADIHLIKGNDFELYNSGYVIELENGNKDIHTIGYI